MELPWWRLLMDTSEHMDTAFRQQHRRWFSALVHLILYDVRYSLSTWRWWFVAPVYGVLGTLYGGLIRFDFIKQQPRSVNIWDVPPVIVSNPWINVLLVAVGFVLLVGDSYARDRDQSLVALTLVRMPSRRLWWVAKLGAIGVLAAWYVTLMFGAILIGSSFSVPIAFTDSPQSLIPTTGTDGWYFRWMNVPMPLFVVLIAVYTTFTVWIVGVVALAAATVSQHIAVPLVVIVTWGISSLLLYARLLSRIPFGELLSLPYFITYAKHLSPYESTSIPLFAVVSLGMLGAAFMVGAWRLQTSDL